MPEYSTYDIIALLVSIMFPPLGVLMKRGLASDFWINIILTFLGWIPGLFHAFFVIYNYRDESNPVGGNRPKHGGSRPIHGGSRPQKIKVHSTDTDKPQYSQHPSQNYQPNYQSQNQLHYQQQQQYHTPPSTPPRPINRSSFYEDTHAGTSNETPPAYGDHGNDKKLKGSYFSGDKKV